jgi:hypothetical protein
MIRAVAIALMLVATAPAAAQDVDELRRKVEEVRGLPVAPVRWSLADRPAFVQDLTQVKYREHSRAWVEDVERRKEAAWSFLGLIPPGARLEEIERKQAENVLGYYVTVGERSLHICRDLTAAGRRTVREEIEKRWRDAEKLADVRRARQDWQTVADIAALESAHGFRFERTTIFHELHHAAQDQKWNLHALGEGDSSDMELAVSALIEGDARAAEAEFAVGTEKAAGLLAVYRAGYERLLQQRDGDAAVPRFMSVTSEFQYSDGAAFVAAVRKERGGAWSVIDDCYAAPPLATREVLHPESYLRRAGDVVAVRMPVLESAGEPLWNDALGEMGLRFVLRETVSDGRLRAVLKPSEADRIAAGWRGDRYQLLRTRDGGLAMAWVSVWSDKRAAAEFAGAYAKVLGWKRPEAKVVSDSGDRYVVRAAGRVSFVARTGLRVLIGEQVPETEAPALERALQGAEVLPLVLAPVSAGAGYACEAHPAWTGKRAGHCRFCGRRMSEAK